MPLNLPPCHWEGRCNVSITREDVSVFECFWLDHLKINIIEAENVPPYLIAPQRMVVLRMVVLDLVV